MQPEAQLIQEAINRYIERNKVKQLATPTLIDYHVHDYRSRDAPTATIPGYIKKAEQIGVKEIAFTNHLIIGGSDQSTSIRLDEIPEYLNDIWRAQEDTDIVLKTGFEVDYIPEKERETAKLLDEYDLDYVLGSVHQVNGVNISIGRDDANLFFKNRNKTEAIEEYYQHMKLAIESEIFDTISHPDYFRKYQTKPIPWKDYGETVLDVIDALKSYGVGYEINTSGYRHGIDDKFPRDEFIEAAYAAGVRTVTLGSDSHYCETIGYNIVDSAALLKTMGYKTVSVFNARREYRIQIDRLFKNSHE